VGSPTVAVVTRWRVMRAGMCLCVRAHVCVCLLVNNWFFRQSRMACSVFQSKCPCRRHDTGLMRMLAACALASRKTGKLFCTCNAQLKRFPSHRALLIHTLPVHDSLAERARPKTQHRVTTHGAHREKTHYRANKRSNGCDAIAPTQECDSTRPRQTRTMCVTCNISHPSHMHFHRTSVTGTQQRPAVCVSQSL